MKFSSILILGTLLWSQLLVAQDRSDYPSHWWETIPRDQAQSWEILPQDAGVGEVILSKRNELGIFSNFGHAPFSYDGNQYASVEGFWQMMKYPDPADESDPRHKFKYPFTREEVRAMHGFEGKRAGDAANEINKAAGIKWVSYKGKRFDYKDMADGSAFHYTIIRGAMRSKLDQNPEVQSLLMKTHPLVLRPDHNVKDTKPPAYKYFKVWMDYRSSLMK